MRGNNIMIGVAYLLLLISALCFLLASLDKGPPQAVPLGLFFLSLYFATSHLR